MVAVSVFLFVFIVCGIAIQHNSELAKFSTIDGVNPFAVAVTAAGIAWRTWMVHARRSSDDS